MPFISNLVLLSAIARINLQIPQWEDAQDTSEKFALVILRNLVEDLKTESVESVCAKADETPEVCLFHHLRNIISIVAINLVIPI